MNAARSVVLGVVLSVVAPVLVRDAQAVQTYYCGSHRVRAGEDTATVLEFCGEPDSASQQIERRTTRQGGGRCGGTLEERTTEVVIDEWIYDYGLNHYARTLHFENGVLVGIASRWVGSH
jgi:hypothetical protein